jgi:hypothetical protein
MTTSSRFKHACAPEYEVIPEKAPQLPILTDAQLAQLANKAILIESWLSTGAGDTSNVYCFVCGANTPNWGGGCMNCGALDSRA